MDNQPLNYMPLKHSRRAPMWLSAGVPAAAVALVLGGNLLYFGAGLPRRVRMILGVAVLICTGIAAYTFILWKKAWEYRLGDQTLEFRRPLDRGWATIQLDQMVAVCQIGDADNDWSYEIVFRNGRRVRIEKQVLGGWADFQRALLGVRPDLHFTCRRVNECPSCGGDLHVRNLAAIYTGAEHGDPRCDRCGARLGCRLKRIPAGGIVLPEGLNS